jgi:ParB family chromosome partitioning protein
MAKRKALGKGLSALIPDAEPQRGGGGRDFFSISVSEIAPNRYQPRRDFDDEKIAELSASIREKGVIQPLIVREGEDGYELIAGERRLRAAIKAGLRQVPVVIKDVSDSEALQIALIENIQREDLNPIEEATVYQRLINEFDLKQDEMAQKVGKDRTTVTNSLRLLTLPEPVKEDLVRGVLTTGHARALLSLPDSKSILKARDIVVAKELSVRETEALTKRTKGDEKKVDKEKVTDPYLMDLEDELTRAVGTKVKISKRGEGGRIEIEYYSQEELERIAEIIRS